MLLAACAIAGSLYIENRRQHLEAGIEDKLKLLASGRAAVVATWLDGISMLPTEIVKSDLIALFAKEITGRNSGDDLPFYLLQQKSYVETVLTEFVSKNDLTTAHLMNADGEILAQNSKAAKVSDDQRSKAKGLADRKAASGLWLRQDGKGLILDVYLPVAATGGESGASPVGVLLMSLPANERFGRFLETSPWFDKLERYHLVSGSAPGGIVSLDGSGTAALATYASVPGPSQTFAPAAGLAGAQNVYSISVDIDQSPWRIVAEVPTQAALAPLQGDRQTLIALSMGLVTFLFLLMLAFWLNQTRQFNEALAEQHEAAALRIDAQRQLLERINESISEGIALKGLDGRYTVANPAFAKLTGRDASDIVGQTSGEIFDADTAARLSTREAAISSGDAGYSVLQSRLPTADGDALVDIVPVPLANREGGSGGFLTVVHDRTQERQAAMRREQAAAQTIVAYMKAVELSDPYLHGQSAFVGDLSKNLAERIGLDADEIETTTICASLFQIGKLFVPQEILRKTDPLSEAETAILRKHVSHLERMLDGLDFGFPVQSTVVRMYERLDGSGYPAGIRDQDIGRPARVLGLADAFCALVRPRAYRPANSPQRALDILSSEAAKYDEGALDALKGAIDDGVVSEIMERLFADEARSA